MNHNILFEKRLGKQMQHASIGQNQKYLIIIFTCSHFSLYKVTKLMESNQVMLKLYVAITINPLCEREVRRGGSATYESPAGRQFFLSKGSLVVYLYIISSLISYHLTIS